MKIKKDMIIYIAISAVVSLILGFVLWLCVGYLGDMSGFMGTFAA